MNKTIVRIIIGSVLAVGGGTAGVVGYKMVEDKPSPPPTHVSTQPPSPPGGDPGEPEEVALARQLRDDCAKKENWERWGAVWVEVSGAKVSDRKLVLPGLVEDQAKADNVKDHAEKLLRERPELAKQCPEGVSLSAMKVLPIGDRLKALQKRWAEADPRADPAGQRDRQVLRQTCLKAAYYSETNRLNVIAVNVSPRDLAAPDNIKRLVADTLRPELKTKPTQPAALPEDYSTRLDLNVELTTASNPAEDVEKAAPDQKTLPGLNLDYAWYDAVGTLQLAGVVARPEERTALQALVKKEFERKWEQEGVVRAGEGDPGWSAQGLQVVDAGALPKLLQTGFAASTQRLRRQTRLDKARFQRDLAYGLRLQFDGLCIYTDPKGSEESGLEKALPQELQRAVGELLKERPGFQVVSTGIVLKPGLAREVQGEANETHELQGIEVNEVYFDQNGTVRQVTLGATEGQKKVVDDIIRKKLNLPAPPSEEQAEPGTVEEQDAPPQGAKPAAKKGGEKTIAEEIQAWLVETYAKPGKNYIRIDKYKPVTPQKGGKTFMQFEGIWIWTDKEPGDAQQGAFSCELECKANDVRKKRREAAGAPPPVGGDELPIDLRAVKIIRSPVADLREQATAAQSQLRGALFDDAWYDEEGKLQLAGYTTGDVQRTLVAGLLRDGKAGEAGVPRKGADATKEPGVDGLKPAPYKDMKEKAQAKFAGSNEDSPLVRALLEDVAFAYTKTDGKPSPVLSCRVRYYRDSKDQAAVDKAQKEINKELTAVYPSVFRREEDTGIPIREELVVEDSPVLALQRRAAASPALDGTLFETARYSAEGKLVLKVYGEEKLSEAITQLVKDAQPQAGSVKPVPYPWPKKEGNWADFRKAMQTSLAAKEVSPKEGPVAPRRTRLDRAYFVYEGDDPSPRLQFVGICIATKGTEEVLRKQLEEHLKPAFAEAFPQLTRKPSITFTQVKIEPFPFQDVSDEIEKDKDLDGSRIESVWYDATGKLHFYGDTVKDGDPQIERILLKVLKGKGILAPESDDKPALPPEKDSAAKPARRRKAGGTETTSTIPGNDAPAKPEPRHTLEDLGVVDWQGILSELRRQLAGDRGDPVFRQTRIDRARFRHQGGEWRLCFDLVCLSSPGGEAVHRKALEERLKEYFLDALKGKTKTDFQVQLLGTPFLRNPVIPLQELAVERGLDDVLFESATYEGRGRLRLRVDLIDLGLRPRIDELLATQRAKDALAPALPKGQDKPEHEPLHLFPWQGEGPEGAALVRRVQKGFAASNTRAAEQTRLNRVYFLYDQQGVRQLHLRGLSLWDGKPKEMPVALLPVCRKVLSELVEQVVTGAVTFVPNPAPDLQQEVAGKPQYDGLLFEDAGFDQTGHLQFEVLVTDSEAQPAEVARLLGKSSGVKTILEDDPAKRKLLPPKFRSFDWDDLLKSARAWAAGPAAPRDARRTRIDRAYFTREDGLCQLQLVGATLLFAPEGDPVAPAAVRTRVVAAFGSRLLDRLRPLQLKLPEGPRPRALAVVLAKRDLVTVLRGAIAAQRSLDGVNVTDAVYAEAGKVALEGHWVSPAQGRELQDLLNEAVQPEAPALTRYGTTLGRLRVVRTDLLLRDLRNWLVDKTEVEEVLFDRLYFDAAGKLRVDGFFTRPEDKEPAEKAGLDGLLAYPIGRSLLGLEPEGGGKPAAGARDVIHLVQRPSLVAYLRTQVPADPTLDGLRIDRCYYDADAVFVLTGLEDAAGQSRGLRQLLEAAREGATFRGHLAGGWRLGRFTVVPLRAMLRCLTRVMPADSIFDGVALDRAYHDAANHLVIAGAFAVFDYPGLERGRKRRLNELRQKKAREALAAMIAGHPDWRKRLSNREPDVAFKVVDADVPLADRAFQRAAEWYGHERKVERALADLDTVLFNTPGDPTAWYFRAVCELALGDAAAARRDLRRVLAFADEQPPLIEKLLDYARLELAQGRNRATASQTAVKMALAVPADKTLAALMKELCEEPLKAPVPDEAPGWDTPVVPLPPPCGARCWLPR